MDCLVVIALVAFFGQGMVGPAPLLARVLAFLIAAGFLALAVIAAR